MNVKHSLVKERFILSLLSIHLGAEPVASLAAARALHVYVYVPNIRVRPVYLRERLQTYAYDTRYSFGFFFFGVFYF